MKQKKKLTAFLLLTAYHPCKGEFTTFISWCNKQLKDYGVNVLLNTKADVPMIKAGNYDEVVVTTGGLPWIPQFIKGIDLPHVKIAKTFSSEKKQWGSCHHCRRRRSRLRNSGTFHSVQKKATIIEMKPILMEELDGVSKENLSKIMDRFHVESYVSTKMLEIRENSVLVETQRRKRTALRYGCAGNGL